MAWVKIGWGFLDIVPHQTDMNCFRVLKIRQPVKCSDCGKKIPSKSYAYGSDWTRLCLKCGNKFCDKGIQRFQEVISHIKFNQKRFKENKDKWESENALALL